MTVCVGYLRSDHCAPEFLECMTDALLKDKRDGQRRLIGSELRMVSGPRIASSRNKMTRDFLEKTDDEWLLAIDADMVFTLEDIYAIVDSAHKTTRPIVGGLYFGRSTKGIEPHMYRLVPEEDPVEVIKDYPENGMVEVDATGAGFLLVHRGVYKRMLAVYGEPFPWFVESTAYRNVEFGEDWAFCVRAKTASIPVYVNTAVKLGHVKTMIITEAMYLANRPLSLPDNVQELETV